MRNRTKCKWIKNLRRKIIIAYEEDKGAHDLYLSRLDRLCSYEYLQVTEVFMITFSTLSDNGIDSCYEVLVVISESKVMMMANK